MSDGNEYAFVVYIPRKPEPQSSSHETWLHPKPWLRRRRWLSPTKLYFLAMLFLTSVLINFLGCLWHAVAKIEGYENSWLVSVGASRERGQGSN